jgi:hypothetical protein
MWRNPSFPLTLESPSFTVLDGGLCSDEPCSFGKLRLKSKKHMLSRGRANCVEQLVRQWRA